MTGIYFDVVTSDWAIEVEAAGGVVGYAGSASEAVARLDEEIARWGRFHATQGASLAAMMPASVAVVVSSTQAPQTATASESDAKPGCPWYRAIRRFYGRAAQAGLNTKADEAMRDALGAYFRRAIQSRSELSADDWAIAARAVMRRELAW